MEGGKEMGLVGPFMCVINCRYEEFTLIFNAF